MHALAALCLPFVLLAGCGGPPPAAEAIRGAGELRVVTLNTGTTYYESARGPAGFEHDLASAFADWLGVAPRFLLAADVAELHALVAGGKAHLGAALLPVLPPPSPELSFGPSYTVSTQLVVCRRGAQRPREPADLRALRGAAVDGRGGGAVIADHLPLADGYDWSVHDDLANDDLLAELDRGAIDYVVLPSLEFHAAHRYFPELFVAFELGAPQPLAWVYRAVPDDSLGEAQQQFLGELRQSGEFDIIYDRYFGHVDEFDYVESRAFLRHYEERLPAWRAAFEAVAAESGIDWRLLAAMSYQESHWRADARSPTGVRGLMMLTRQTAAALGVDRLEPEDSIRGGARYLDRMKEKLPARIAEPDRTWLALAAYNVGPAHLEDARVLTEQAGGNADLWAEVRTHLPKLANRKWARKVRHGYARGYQAVHFVRNIRRYYDVLRWLEPTPVPNASRSSDTPRIAPALSSPVL